MSSNLPPEKPLKAPPRVLLVEDDEDVAFGVQALLDASKRFTAYHAPTAAAARDALSRVSFDAVLTDLSLPDDDGLHLLEEIAASHPGVGLLCLTGRNEASSAVRALRAGAIDYLTKPASGAQILQALDSLVARSPRRGDGDDDAPGFPVGDAPSWRRVVSLIEAAARSPRTTVLLTGEPGVGKEEAAALLHRLSKRSDAPFITANAACLSPSLIESELFGHEAGAFTGALRQRRGLFEQADRGALFLDEIGELPLELQPKLLRVLEGHPFSRVGGERPISVSVRLVCATNRNLEELVRSGAFRADLYERLRVFEVRLPPLRERPGDVPLLARHFAAKLGPELGVRVAGFSAEAMEALERHSYPGNVRELRNMVERAMILAAGGVIERRHLMINLGESLPQAAPAPAPANDLLELIVREHILRVYERTGRNVTHTALALGMSRLAVRNRLRSYGVRTKGEDTDPGRSTDDR